jgi:hypothetical protein
MLASEGPTAQLRDWSVDLASRRSAVVPHFDPTDAGVGARVLLLLEAPGPMTNASNPRPGSGFISADNDDQTAENVWLARTDAGLLDGTVHWNIVPWYLGPASKKPSADELAQGSIELRGLLPLLPVLQVVVLSGRFAQKGWNTHVAPFLNTDLAVIETWHPSGQSMSQAGHREHLHQSLASAASYV